MTQDKAVSTTHDPADVDRHHWLRRERTRRIAAMVVLVLAALQGSTIFALMGANEGGDPDSGVRAGLRLATVVVVLNFAFLLLVVRGLRRGQSVAFFAAIASLAIMILNDFEGYIGLLELAITAIAIIWLVVNRDAFPTKPSRRSMTQGALIGIGGSLLLILVASAVGEFIVKDRLGLLGPNQLRAMTQDEALELLNSWFGNRWNAIFIGVLCLSVMAGALWVITSPAKTPRRPDGEAVADREAVRPLVRRYGRSSLDYFALRNDKYWHVDGDSVVAYAIDRGTCLVSPDPICHVDDRRAVWARFLEMTERHGWQVAVLGASEEWAQIYKSFGMTPIYLGDEGVVDCRAFTLQGRAMRGLRQAFNRVERSGFTVEFHDPATLSAEIQAELKPLLDMSRRGDDERGFSMTLSRIFDPLDDGLLVSIARDADGVPRALAQWMPCSELDGWSLDIMRRDTDAELPNGIMDYMVITMIQHVAETGGHCLALNFAVMRKVIAGEASGRMATLGRQALKRMGSSSQMESLWRFNEKFDPIWKPRYVVISSTDQAAAQGLVVAHAEGLIGELRLPVPHPRHVSAIFNRRRNKQPSAPPEEPARQAPSKPASPETPAPREATPVGNAAVTAPVSTPVRTPSAPAQADPAEAPVTPIKAPAAAGGAAEPNEASAQGARARRRARKAAQAAQAADAPSVPAQPKAKPDQPTAEPGQPHQTADAAASPACDNEQMGARARRRARKAAATGGKDQPNQPA